MTKASLETVDDSMAGLQVIEKFNQAVSHLSIAGDISLNGMGEIQRSIFQFEEFTRRWMAWHEE